MKNIVSCKRFFYAVSLIFVFFVSGCTNSDKVDPDEVIKEFGQDAQQLAMVEIEDRQLRLMTPKSRIFNVVRQMMLASMSLS